MKTEDNPLRAGYVATGGAKPFTYVAAEFTVAAVNCGVTPHFSWTSQWVGLDGWHGKTVEQIGVKSECGGDRELPPNAAHYFAWWEMYPDAVRVLESVNAGDTLGQFTDLIGNFSTKLWTNIAAIQAQENGHGDLVVDADPTPLSDGGTAFSVVWHSDK